MAKVEETIALEFEWMSVEPDPAQFKPSRPSLRPISQVIELEVPVSLGVRLVEDTGRGRDEVYVLSLEAWAWVNVQLKNAMQKAEFPGRK